MKYIIDEKGYLWRDDAFLSCPFNKTECGRWCPMFREYSVHAEDWNKENAQEVTHKVWTYYVQLHCAIFKLIYELEEK